jgi:hypothetical protein
MATETLLGLVLLVVSALAEETSAPTLAPVTMKQQPQYTYLSYFTGLLVMLAFVVAPVGMMAYRNRNSIVEFIKNR